MATPIGLQRVSCSAHPGQSGKQCRATKGLIATLIKPEAKGSLILPEYVVIMLCPKHFVIRAKGGD